MGVANGPFNAIVFFLTMLAVREGLPEAIASSGMAVLPSFRIGVTSTGSQTMGVYLSGMTWDDTFAAAKMDSTLSAISGPIPSPGIMVTVYSPYHQSCKRDVTSLFFFPVNDPLTGFGGASAKDRV